MDVDETAVVRSGASQLRSKINNCIDKATQRKNSEDENSNHLLEEAEDEDDEAESLLNIREALESLEEQLGSLQQYPSSCTNLKLCANGLSDHWWHHDQVLSGCEGNFFDMPFRPCLNAPFGQ